MRRLSGLLLGLLLASPAAAERLEAPCLPDPLPLGEDLYGVYVEGRKCGWARLDLSVAPAATPDGGFLGTLEMEARTSRLGEQIEVEIRAVDRFAPTPPHAYAGGSFREWSNRGLRATTVRRGTDGFFASLRDGRRWSTRDVEVEFTLADALGHIPWIRGRPEIGSTLRLEAFETLEARQDRFAYELTDRTHPWSHGVRAEISEVRMASERQGDLGRARFLADGTVAVSPVGSVFEIRLEPAELARTIEFTSPPFLLGFLPTDDPGPLASIRRLVVRFEGWDADEIPSGPGQRVRVEADGDAARVALENVDAPAAPEEIQEHLRACPRYPLADPRIRAMADRALADAHHPADLLDRLLGAVTSHLSPALVTRPRTVEDLFADPRGDATEHALLFVTLARAAGLPAREVGGLVWEGGGFTGEVWAEVVLGDRWVAVDPVAGLPRAGLARVALVRGEVPTLSFLLDACRWKASVVEIERE